MKFFLVALSVCVSFSTFSKEISVTVLSKDNIAVSNVVITLKPIEKREYAAPEGVAVMDQVDTQFLPHILIVQQDAKVIFPNSDSIKHHVYSFSSAKTFELQLYKDLQAEPLLFSNPGVVELGCNIHDWMLGYIFVADTPYFGKTDTKGSVTLDVPDGEYVVNVWSPRFQEEIEILTRSLTIPSQDLLEVRLRKPLMPDLNEYEQGADDFSDYE